MKTKREEIAEFEELLTKATFGNYTEGKYSDVSEIVRFMQSDMKPIKAELLKQVAFIVGPSGAGKSTLMNDLAKENNLIIAENSNGELMLKARDSITAIGLGEGSTTLFPTAWSPTHLTGIFLDCAGEGDTGGVIARAINALIKSVIASNVEQAKLLFVAAQPSLSAKGSYGESFKKSLDANAQFLNDINYFKDSIAFVVSHAGLRPNTHDTVKSLIQTILEKHGNLNNYKDAVTSVLQREEERAFSRISTFSEPNNSSKTGDFYISPVW
jgi:energy-coupling factor transporter ATP-binding protein EcfA2